ncbi:MAG: glycoside hydrolase family 3 C-terminal domain-containing protein [Anaerolineales bacterium]|nr:glycoside hydrolase family 3 C-terminal domain-containing protein [Anaerolineales bacterium]
MQKTSPAPAAFRNPDLPPDARIADLLDRLTLDEKIGLMIHPARGVPRLDIPAYNYWSEGLHGLAGGRATVFPQAIGMAATWDPGLIHRVGAAIADEARARYHETLRRKGQTGLMQGLTYWSPNINIFRDPRWGRGQETWGEDPFLTGELGAAFVRGMQGDDPRYLKVAACAKHFAVHSGPERERHRFNAIVSRRDLYDTYLPAFQKLVCEARVEAVMGAYNRVNGEAACASQTLLVEILRGAWNFDGHVVSDCWAIRDIHAEHKLVDSPEQAAAAALTHGCDLNCGCTYTQEILQNALDLGLIGEADLDRSLTRLLRTRLRLGMFDPPERVPYASIPPEVIGSPEHRQLAREAAARSFVLLKNDGLLPIRPEADLLYITGPNAASLDVLLANYCGFNENMVTALEGLTGRTPEDTRLSYRMGCQLIHPNLNPVDWSLGDGAAADVTIACMGLSPLLESEEGDSLLTPLSGDREDITLPQVQVEYLKALAAGGARIVLVLFSGSPLALGEVAGLAQAILWVGYPGQEGGNALAEVLFGDRVPSGRLPLTFPQSLDQLPPFEDYSMTGRTYRYMTGEPLYPFGFGLSYTTFAYRDLEPAGQEIQAGSSQAFRLTVSNTGERAGEEVVQFYLADLQASAVVPQHKLIGFQRIALEPGELRTVEMILTPGMMSLIDDEGRTRLEPGTFRLTVGGCSPGKRGVALGAAEPVSVAFEVTGKARRA